MSRDRETPSGLLPYVRHMLLVEDVEINYNNHRKLSLHGLLNNITVKRYPVRVGFSAFLLMAEGRRPGLGRILVSNATTDDIIYVGSEHPLAFTGDPLQVKAFSFRIVECQFESPRLYWVSFCFNDVLLSQEPLTLR